METQKAVSENSECILVGKVRVFDVIEQLFEIEVIESLDGSDMQGNIYLGWGWKRCSPYIDTDGFWLIYGDTENGYLRPRICGISRSFEMFGRKRIQNLEKIGIKQDSFNKELRKDFLNSLYFELKALRRRNSTQI